MIYFAQQGAHGPFKIGCTKRQYVYDRIRHIEVATKRKLIVRGVMPGDFEEERRLHLKFHEYRLGHEWFKPSKAIKRFAASLSPAPAKKEYRGGHNPYLTNEDLRLMGSKGGLAAAQKAAATRDAIATLEQVREMMRAMPWKEVSRKLGPPFSYTTLWRHYSETKGKWSNRDSVDAQ